MAIVVLEVNRKPQPAGCKCNAQATTKPDATKMQPVMQRAATMPPPVSSATPTQTEKAEEWSLSYSAWLALLSVVGGIVIISQAKK